MSKISLAAVLTFSLSLIGQTQAATSGPRPEEGYSAGYLRDCPGVLKNASISAAMMPRLQVMIHRVSSTGQIFRKEIPVETAPKTIAMDKNIDLKNKKTVFYAIGYLETSRLPFSLSIGTAYSKRGYNVFISETLAFLTNIYPKSARLVRALGEKYGKLLVKLTELGLKPENLELVGASLGAHVIGYAAKYFYKATGKKASRITGLDPAGPCFRNLGSENKLWKTDAERVEIVHTNIDGFGIAEPLGHLDIYVNGGEYQPGDVPFIPCLVVCSHVKAFFYWWQALEHPKKFIAIKCNTVQEARFAQCYKNSQTNYLGLEAKFDRPGIYYLSTSNEFPYYRSKDGLKAENENFNTYLSMINAENEYVV